MGEEKQIWTKAFRKYDEMICVRTVAAIMATVVCDCGMCGVRLLRLWRRSFATVVCDCGNCVLWRAVVSVCSVCSLVCSNFPITYVEKLVQASNCI